MDSGASYILNLSFASVNGFTNIPYLRMDVICLAHSKHSVVVVGGEKMGKLNATACDMEMLEIQTINNYRTRNNESRCYTV